MNAIINSGPREDSTRIGRAGTVRRQAVDVSPLRRVNQVIFHIKMGSLTFQNGCLIDPEPEIRGIPLCLISWSEH